MNDSYFYSQFIAFQDTGLERYTCGVCCVAMAASMILGREIRPKLVIEELALLHNDGIPVYKRSIPLSDKTIDLTVGLPGYDGIFDSDRLTEPHGTPQFAFTLQGGYDHRISSILFQKWGIDASIRQDLMPNELIRLLGNNKLALASIISPTTNARHVVIVTLAPKNGTIIIIDPLYYNWEEGMRHVSHEDFALIFNGLATLIKGLF